MSQDDKMNIEARAAQAQTTTYRSCMLRYSV